MNEITRFGSTRTKLDGEFAPCTHSLSLHIGEHLYRDLQTHGMIPLSTVTCVTAKPCDQNLKFGIATAVVIHSCVDCINYHEHSIYLHPCTHPLLLCFWWTPLRLGIFRHTAWYTCRLVWQSICLAANHVTKFEMTFHFGHMAFCDTCGQWVVPCHVSKDPCKGAHQCAVKVSVCTVQIHHLVLFLCSQTWWFRS